MATYELRRLEYEVERLRKEDEFVRERMISNSVAIDELIEFVTTTPEPLGNSDKAYQYTSRKEKQQACLMLLWCLKTCYPSTYHYLRRKICEPLLLMPGFKWMVLPGAEEKKTKKGVLGKFKVFGKQYVIWWKSKPEMNTLTKSIDEELAQERGRQGKQLKLLMMGTGGSGKSTIMKQMKICHSNGFSKSELMGYKPVLHSNVIEAMQILIQGCQELGIVWKEHLVLATKVEQLFSIQTVLNEGLAQDLETLWNSVEIQQAYEHRSELRLPSNVEYFMNNLARFSKPDFMPTHHDVLRCRARTTGIHQVEFDSRDYHLTAIDVGGARSERKKWAWSFEDVSAILFVVAMDEYDQKLYEDENVCCIQESRKLFDDIINSKWFQNTNIILILNKSDLFKEKIKRVDLKVCFPDYKEGKNYEPAVTFLKHKFRKLNRRAGRAIYEHITCAIDDDCAKEMFNYILDSFMQYRRYYLSPF